jgi:uncharacterized protein (DUF2141 family)
MRPICRWLTFLLFSLISSGLQSQGTSLSITITHIETEKGVVRVALYDHPDQFPYDPARNFVLPKNNMKNGMLNLVIPDLREGVYAISLLDDVNGNDEMDYNILHIPKEGYGFSNDVRPGLKPPPYEKCTFTVGKGETRMVIRIQYFGKG